MKEPFELDQDPSFLLIKQWQKLNPAIIAGFTTRQGGVSNAPFNFLNLGLHVNDLESAVQENRRILGEKLLISPTSWVCGEQIHSNRVVEVSNEDKGKGAWDLKSVVPDVDGLYTNHFNLLLTAGFADCVPVFLYSPDNNLIGIAHAGWKGSVNNIIQEMVKKWVAEAKVDPGAIYAAIGPSIGECCYKVDDYVINKVDLVLTGKKLGRMPYKQVSEDQYLLNLKKLNEILLLNAGVPKENIMISSYCTSCETQLFFSHRRDEGATGRMFGFIGLF